MEVDIIDNSKEYLKALSEQIEAASIAIGLTAESYAKRDCPVDTGRLRGSITFATETFHSIGESPAESSDYETHGTSEKGSIYIGTNVEYAASIELGTSSMKRPRPFLSPAATQHGAEYKNLVEQALKSK